MKNIVIFFTFCFLLFSMNCFAGNTKTSQEPEIQVSGEETWIVQGTEYKIDGSMLVRVSPFPNHLYAIRVLISEKPDEKDEPLAKAIGKYALENGYLESAKKIEFNGSPVVLVPKIGVAVIRKTGLSIFNHAEGYRFQFDIDELQ